MLTRWNVECGAAFPSTQSLAHEIGGEANLIAAIRITKLCLLCYDTYLTLTLFTFSRRCDGVHFRYTKRYGNVEWTRTLRSPDSEEGIFTSLMCWDCYLEYFIGYFNRTSDRALFRIPAYIFGFRSRSFFSTRFFDLVSDKKIDISIFEYQFNDFNTQQKKIVNGIIEITIFIAFRVRTRQRSPRRLAHSE